MGQIWHDTVIFYLQWILCKSLWIPHKFSKKEKRSVVTLEMDSWGYLWGLWDFGNGFARICVDLWRFTGNSWGFLMISEGFAVADLEICQWGGHMTCKTWGRAWRPSFFWLVLTKLRRRHGPLAPLELLLFCENLLEIHEAVGLWKCIWEHLRGIHGDYQDFENRFARFHEGFMRSCRGLMRICEEFARRWKCIPMDWWDIGNWCKRICRVFIRVCETGKRFAKIHRRFLRLLKWIHRGLFTFVANLWGIYRDLWDWRWICKDLLDIHKILEMDL